MSSSDEFEVVAEDAEEGFYFHVSYAEKDIKVYAEDGAKHVSVYQAGEMLSCGLIFYLRPIVRSIEIPNIDIRQMQRDRRVDCATASPDLARAIPALID